MMTGMGIPTAHNRMPRMVFLRVDMAEETLGVSGGCSGYQGRDLRLPLNRWYVTHTVASLIVNWRSVETPAPVAPQP